MKTGISRRNPKRSSEGGYALIVIMIMVAIMAVLALAHTENVVTQIRRDREEELVHRGAQYARAIKKYQAKFPGQYPTTIDQLEKSNNVRFLRKRYKDPITGQDFKLLRLGDLAAILGQGSGTGDSKSGSDTSTISSSNSSNNPNSQAVNSILSTMGLNQGANQQTPFGQQNSLAPKSIGSGPTFGGGPILGVASTSPKTSLKEFNNKNHYKDWAFIYLQQLDLCRGGGAVPVPAVPVQNPLQANPAVAVAQNTTCPLIKGPYVPPRTGAGVSTNMGGGITAYSPGSKPQ